jgi:hypothetical protein
MIKHKEPPFSENELLAVAKALTDAAIRNPSVSFHHLICCSSLKVIVPSDDSSTATCPTIGPAGGVLIPA